MSGALHLISSLAVMVSACVQPRVGRVCTQRYGAENKWILYHILSTFIWFVISINSYFLLTEARVLPHANNASKHENQDIYNIYIYI